jgi:hypothetical protein
MPSLKIPLQKLGKNHADRLTCKMLSKKGKKDGFVRKPAKLLATACVWKSIMI